MQIKFGSLRNKWEWMVDFIDGYFIYWPVTQLFLFSAQYFLAVWFMLVPWESDISSVATEYDDELLGACVIWILMKWTELILRMTNTIVWIEEKNESTLTKKNRIEWKYHIESEVYNVTLRKRASFRSHRRQTFFFLNECTRLTAISSSNLRAPKNIIPIRLLKFGIKCMLLICNSESLSVQAGPSMRLFNQTKNALKWMADARRTKGAWPNHIHTHSDI